MNKVCSKCKENKDLSNFYRQSKSRDGLTAWCKICKRNDTKEWTARNKESELERQRDWYQDNRAKKNALSREWQLANKAKVNAITAKRRATKLLASPSWVNEEDNSKIKKLYQMARELTIKTGIKHEVDHVVPLQGEDVCGLHVPWNLQILTKYENLAKGNSLVAILNVT